jgi:MYXO-CTERM domain-containing protein
VRRLQLTAIGALAALTAASALVPCPARASCTSPTPTVVWSYPRDGETDVPTNVTLWLLLSNWHKPGKVRLDGKELPVNGFGFGYRPLEPMAPSSPHELSIDAALPGAEPPVTLTIRFTTASGETEREPAMVPAVSAVSATQSRPLSNVCQSVVHAMDCFDTGQDTHLVFDSEARPFVWIVERVPMLMGESPVFTLWPGECELPEIFVSADMARTCGYRYRLHAVEATGLRAMSPPFCPSELIKAVPGDDGGAPPAPDAGAPPEDAGAPPTMGGANTGAPRVDETDSSGGCSVGGAPGGGALLLLALALLRRRRRA